MIDHPEYDNHENVMVCRRPESNLTAIIAVHSTTLGPAAGGCRMWPYTNFDDALTDVLRLSRAMTYKNALAGLPLGGGKSVIIGDPKTEKTPELLTSFAECINLLGGKYFTAEDVGIAIDDVEVLVKHSRYVFGLANSGAKTGDPSPFTARGGYHGIRAAVKKHLNKDHLTGIRVAVQGVGNVGYQLCRQLHDDGVKLIVADTSHTATDRCRDEFQAQVVDIDAIYEQDVDVFSPCALGGVINTETIPRLKAKIIAGVANNQLATATDEQLLHDRGILYAPDYVINAGGMHNAARDIVGDYGEPEVLRRIDAIYELMLNIFDRADNENQLPTAIANEISKEIIKQGNNA